MNQETHRHYIVLYDDQCALCRSGMRLVQRLDWRNLVRFVPIAEALIILPQPMLNPETSRQAMHVVTPSGQVRIGWDAVTALARVMPLTWIVGALGNTKPFRWLGHGAYRWVAQRRHLLGRHGCQSCGSVVEATQSRD